MIISIYIFFYFGPIIGCEVDPGSQLLLENEGWSFFTLFKINEGFCFTSEDIGLFLKRKGILNALVFAQLIWLMFRKKWNFIGIYKFLNLNCSINKLFELIKHYCSLTYILLSYKILIIIVCWNYNIQSASIFITLS